jgi:hypothetical protein
MRCVENQRIFESKELNPREAVRSKLYGPDARSFPGDTDLYA